MLECRIAPLNVKNYLSASQISTNEGSIILEKQFTLQNQVYNSFHFRPELKPTP